MRKTTTFCFLLLLAAQLVFAQNRKIDSLKSVAKETENDSIRVEALNDLSWELSVDGKYLEAIEIATQSKELSEKIGFTKGLGSAYSNLGIVYYAQSNYPRALDYHFRSLKTMESIGNKNGMGVSYNNIGNVYSEQGDDEKVLEYYLKDLKICEELNDKEGMSVSYANIGIQYNEMKMYKEAIEYNLKSLKIKEELGNSEGIGMSYLNLSVVYEDLKEYEKALDYSFKALALLKEYGAKSDVGIVYINLGSVYNKLGNHKFAVNYSKLGLALSEEIGEIDNIRLCYENMATAYASLKDYTQAYKCHVKFKQLTDSIFNEENSKQLGDIKTNYQVEKKEAELTAKAALEKERLKTISAEEDKRHKIVVWSIGAILLIVVVFSVFLYKRFRITNKQKDIIEIQKHLVDEKQKEIIDSITYAKRIQQAILPAVGLMKKSLPHSFILYKPKDIVAGDFFWFESLDSPKQIFIAAADCTGHGVPGAMVSVVCSNALNRAVNEFKIRETGFILDKTKDLVIETFEKSGEGVMDGMDISLASITHIENVSIRLNWSGANNPLWYVKNEELMVLKGDKQPIGKSDHHQSFTTHTVELNRGDVFYLFTDGYVDQFGGPKGKKFKHKQMQELISSIFKLPLVQQSEMLAQKFEEWMGDLEQADDVTVIGIRV
ncbi:MAG: tetratricopeptide repeat protein [Bacteroidota bacterium]|nr:tetratricopeptide repeat protein [Bacteroidota bacterium]